MRLALKFAACLLISQPAIAQDKTFDFMGFSTSSPAQLESRLAGKKCRVAQQGISSCNIFAGAVVGRARVLNLTVKFNNAHLIVVSAWIPSHHYDDVADAFDAKFGLPSATETRDWQNKAGNKFDNEVRTWNFANGTLELHQRGDQRDLSEFIFVSNENLPPSMISSPPPVNF